MCIQHDFDVFARRDHLWRRCDAAGALSQKVRARFKELVNEYVKTPDLEDYIVTPALGNNAGTIGCLALAREVKLHS